MIKHYLKFPNHWNDYKSKTNNSLLIICNGRSSRFEPRFFKFHLFLITRNFFMIYLIVRQNLNFICRVKGKKDIYYTKIVFTCSVSEVHKRIKSVLISSHTTANYRLLSACITWKSIIYVYNLLLNVLKPFEELFFQ